MLEPLAERMRPATLEDFVGQQHITRPGSPLMQAMASGYLPSLLIWGPPGCGKTTLARLLAAKTNSTFERLSAVESGVKELRAVINKPATLHRQHTVLFIDEIHRFNKGQQDALLHAVETGQVSFIGATTENPSFYVNNALLSRCQLLKLQPLGEDELIDICRQALQKDEIINNKVSEVKEWTALVQLSGGDARRMLNNLETVAMSQTGKTVVTDKLVMECITEKPALFDRAGDMHYELASAMIKSIRGSDPDAAVYWLARLLNGGEDLRFIARRLLISASEDIGLANPGALNMALSAWQAVERLGMPEGRIILSQAAIYLATSPKSNSAYLAVDRALDAAKKADLPVPLHLRNAPTGLMKDQGYGRGYLYPHDYAGNFVNQAYLPDELAGEVFYHPADNGREKAAAEVLERLWPERYKKEGR